jgi:hypothetical protein
VLLLFRFVTKDLLQRTEVGGRGIAEHHEHFFWSFATTRCWLPVLYCIKELRLEGKDAVFLLHRKLDLEFSIHDPAIEAPNRALVLLSIAWREDAEERNDGVSP